MDIKSRDRIEFGSMLCPFQASFEAPSSMPLAELCMRGRWISTCASRGGSQVEWP